MPTNYGAKGKSGAFVAPSQSTPAGGVSRVSAALRVQLVSGSQPLVTDAGITSGIPSPLVIVEGQAVGALNTATIVGTVG